MSGINIDELKPRKEAADGGYGLVGDVLALCAAYEQRRLLEAPFVWVAEGEVAQIIQILGENLERDPELHNILLCLTVVGIISGGEDPVRIAEQELPDVDVVFVGRQDRVGLALPRHAGVFDVPHPANVGREVATQRRVYGRVVDGYEV